MLLEDISQVKNLHINSKSVFERFLQEEYFITQQYQILASIEKNWKAFFVSIQYYTALAQFFLTKHLFSKSLEYIIVKTYGSGADN